MHPSLNPTKAFYDRISTAYDLIADASEHAARDRGIELLAPAPRETALVVGFGTGHSLVALARAVGATGRIFGVDISEGMLSVAHQRVVEEQVAERVDISLGDARHLTYGNGQFDAVFIAFTLELFDDEDIPRVLEQIRRVLRPGGRLGVVAMSKEQQETVATGIYVWMHRHFPHWVDCRPISVATCLQRAGFVVERTETLSLWGLPVAIVMARNPENVTR
jgi:ubiquinone/menaquinone biosynthesis C-methylase UbiE